MADLDETSRIIGQIEQKVNGLDAKVDEVTTQVHSISDMLQKWRDERDKSIEDDRKEFSEVRSRVNLMWKSALWVVGVLASSATAATAWILSRFGGAG